MNKIDLQYYGDYVGLLIANESRLCFEINEILAELTLNAKNTPAEHIRSRIKGAESIQEKLRKRGFSNDAKTGLTVLSDVIGARIVTRFIGDIYMILAQLEKSDWWEVTQIKDYISNPKPNGYRSLHVILRLPVEHSDFSFIMAEIQLRTIAMDCWASLEHHMKYKKSVKNAELIISELKRCADEMASTDLSMQTIRDLIQA